MATFKRRLTIGSNWIHHTVALGGSATKGKFKDKDIGKPVKLLAASESYDICAAGDQIEHILAALVPQQPTVNDGYQVGTIQKSDYEFLAIIDDVTVPPAVGKYVVAGTQAEVGVSNSPADKPTTAYAKVRCVADPSTLIFKWRIASIISGTGVGAVVLCEKV